MTAGERIIKFIEQCYRDIYGDKSLLRGTVLGCMKKLDEDDIKYIMDRHNNTYITRDNEIKEKIID